MVQVNKIGARQYTPVSIGRIEEDVRILTAVHPPRNYRNVQSLDKTADYITAEFKKMKCRVDFQRFVANEKEYRNIVCSFGPEQGERIIVGAHYDVYGDQPGADDNASGVAGLLEVGRLLAGLKPSLKYRTDLVAFTLEEPIFFKTRHMGSRVYAQSLSAAGVKVRAMIALEMIGFFTDKPDSQRYPVFFLKWKYPSVGNYIAVVGNLDQGELVEKTKGLLSKTSKVPVHSISAPSFLPGIDFSDHQSFWKYGYPAVMITDTAFYRNKNYHRETDTIDTLDFERMAEVVKGLYWVIVGL
ncbi:MAG: peptidase M28 [Spirochaetes bacterium RBG_16_49_21]|nr:MAG: peptidase M28 [Spirochaetes bacterium RBG_16_49_21]